jgi:hypothetical protein
MKSILSIRMLQGPSWSWLYGSWIYNYLCNQCLSPLKLWVRIPLMRGVLDATLCYKVCQWIATGRWFSPGTPVPSTNKTDRLDRTEILLKVALSTITPVIMFNFDLLYIKNTYTRSVCVIDRKADPQYGQTKDYEFVLMRVASPLYLWTVVSVSWSYKNPSQHFGVVQKRCHHLIEK